MAEFKIGDVVYKAKAYSLAQYCAYGGEEKSVPIGTKGTIIEIVQNRTAAIVRFDNKNIWQVSLKELQHYHQKTTEMYPVAKFCLSLNK